MSSIAKEQEAGLVWTILSRKMSVPFSQGGSPLQILSTLKKLLHPNGQEIVQFFPLKQVNFIFFPIRSIHV